MQSQKVTDIENNDFLLFNEEEDEGNEKLRRKKKPWKILIVDDDEDIHILTRLVLRGYEFDGEDITLLSAYSGRETREIIANNHDIAVILLDVIMEDEYTGLELVKQIREDLNNRKVRIILRTGQPGGALERKVVSSYEIDDYKTKTELTSDKLFTSITTALRAYRDIAALDKIKVGMSEILNIMPKLLSAKSFMQLSENILLSLNSLLLSDSPAEYSRSISSLLAASDNNEFRIIAATGEFKDKTGVLNQRTVSDNIYNELKKTADKRTDTTHDEFLIRFLELSNHENYIIYLKSGYVLSKEEKELASAFLENVKMLMNCYNNHARYHG